MTRSRFAWFLLALALSFPGFNTTSFAADGKPFRIQIVDDQTERGVPLVELTTVNNLQFLTDSQGIVAVDEPDLRDQEVYFQIRSHGYEYAADGFGFRGQRVTLTPGGSVVLKIHRRNLAERMYRVTGAGIYRDSVLVGADVPLKQPLLNAKVFGQDSVLTGLYKGNIYWFWGDTNRPSYILGNFHVPGATSLLPAKGGLAPSRGVDLEYFVANDGFAKETAKLPGEGPTWLDGLTVLRDSQGGERMFAGSMKVRKLLEVYQRGIVEWNDQEKLWKFVADLPVDAPSFPAGNAVEIAGDGGPWVYFGRPLPLTRVKATPEAFLDVRTHEAFSCLKVGTTLAQGQIERDAQGKPKYEWKKNTPPVPALDQAKLVDRKVLDKADGLIQLRDHKTGDPVLVHAGSTYWNAHRKRWVMIAVQWAGTSVLGEVWYAESETPLGPWAYAVKVITHDKYSYYNPKQQPLFDEEGGKRIYFEGTYASTFSGNTDPTPRYDYNQIMYRLDLDDPRTVLPVAIHRQPNGSSGDLLRPLAARNEVASRQVDSELLSQWRTDVEFFAPDRSAPDLIPISLPKGRESSGEIVGQFPADAPIARPAFYVLPVDVANPPATTVPLYAFRSVTGEVMYSIQSEWEDSGKTWRRDPQPVGRVWRNPWIDSPR